VSLIFEPSLELKTNSSITFSKVNSTASVWGTSQADFFQNKIEVQGSDSSLKKFCVDTPVAYTPPKVTVIPGYSDSTGAYSITAHNTGVYDTGVYDTASLTNAWVQSYTTNKDGTVSASIYCDEIVYGNKISQLKDHIKTNLLIKTSKRGFILSKRVSSAEQKARETLRDMILESAWRRYITNGFLMVQGQSDKWYQIFNDQRHIKVYKKGKCISEICIHTDRSCPPSDHIINMKLMIELDEKAVWSGGNIYKPYDFGNISVNNQSRNLITLYNELKAV